MLEHIMNLCFVDGFSGCRTNRANAIENASMNRHSQYCSLNLSKAPETFDRVNRWKNKLFRGYSSNELCEGYNKSHPLEDYKVNCSKFP